MVRHRVITRQPAWARVRPMISHPTMACHHLATCPPSINCDPPTVSGMTRGATLERPRADSQIVVRRSRASRWGENGTDADRSSDSRGGGVPGTVAGRSWGRLYGTYGALSRGDHDTGAGRSRSSRYDKGTRTGRTWDITGMIMGQPMGEPGTVTGCS